MHNILSQIKDFWEPIYDPNAGFIRGKTIGKLPEEFHLEGDRLLYQGRWYEQNRVSYSINEGRSDAWCASLDINESVLYRWITDENDKGDWKIVVEKSHIDISSGGRTMETIEVMDDNSVEWKIHCFE